MDKLLTGIPDVDKALEGGLKKGELFCLMSGANNVNPLGIRKTITTTKPHPNDAYKPIKNEASGIDYPHMLSMTNRINREPKDVNVFILDYCQPLIKSDMGSERFEELFGRLRTFVETHAKKMHKTENNIVITKLKSRD